MAGEPLAHKLLDLIGDLGPWRARGRVVGTLEVEAPSHRRNRDAIEAAFTAGTLRWA
jgi:UDP-3-O-acyl-N-acetylglucosamine deacetylase